MEETRGEMRELMEKNREARRRLEEAVMSTQPEPPTIERFAREIGETEVRLALTRAHALGAREAGVLF